MIIYEVNLTVSNTIFEKYYSWLIDHVKDMLQFDGFIDSEIAIVALNNQNTKEVHPMPGRLLK